MKLEFTIKREFGKDRYYADNTEARALMDLTGRKCLKEVEIARLKWAGYIIFTRAADRDATPDDRGGDNG